MDAHHVSIPILSIIPFVLMLLSIAVFPLFWEHFWENNRNKLIIAVILSIPTTIYLLSAGLSHELVEIMVFDYIPFIILLGALFTITGGIYLSGDIEATPKVNSIFLGIGAILASFMGTTGAAMLLIRPVIQTNKERNFKVHTILFFIAIVANCGGLLTPLGDPPLFMMYLRGAPFTWFFKLVPEWLFSNLLLIIIYFIVDSYYHKKEPQQALKIDKENQRPIKLEGKLNFVWLIGVVLSVAFLNEQYLHFIKENEYYKFIREAVILGMAILSLLFTPKLTRQSNNFTWEPIKEVAYLFLGIFITMVPALLYLETNAHQLGVSLAHQFYYYTGALSSFLDNTPTAVTFHSLALGLGIESGNLVAGIPEELLKAISVAAVLFGSMTYIGNGPNFMVKAVAEENNIKMPSFFAYMYKFSLIILLPVFILIQLLFI
ncbi:MULTISPECIES: sodium:proton antiporter [Melioribacter]|uniref:sodium:proton antiporter n=1 Tax=Melioribacter TaxID=1134403 RepID=UPI00059CF46C|nr:sodium:proton antiporter [Melioribacter roseus]